MIHIIDFDGSERAETDMESHMRDIDAFFFDIRQQLFCEMQTGCRSRSRAVMFRVDCVVAAAVLELMMDIWR